VLEKDPTREMVHIAADGPLIRYRRLVKAALAAEQQSAEPAAAV